MYEKRRVMKKKRLIVVLAAAMLMLLLSSFAVCAEDNVPLGTKGQKAKSIFKVSDINVFAVTTMDELNTALADASKAGSLTSFAMVYVAPGSYKVSKTIVVPENVVLAGENTTVFTNDGTGIMVKNGGAVFGGTYDGANTASNIIRYQPVAFKAPNGMVRSTVVKNSSASGIMAIGADTSNVKTLYNTVSYCKSSGITTIYGAYSAQIAYNKISNIGKVVNGKPSGSGIDVTHANAGTIQGNTISSCKGHGISTDTEQKGKAHKYVRIKNIKGNKISKTGCHGVWLEDNCKVTVAFNNNTITGAGLNGIAVAKNAGIAAMTGNIVKSSKRSNISLGGRGSIVTLKGKNKITYAKNAPGIVLGAYAKLNINGTGNVIKYNAKGIHKMASSAKIVIKYPKRNTFQKKCDLK